MFYRQLVLRSCDATRARGASAGRRFLLLIPRSRAATRGLRIGEFLGPQVQSEAEAYD